MVVGVFIVMVLGLVRLDRDSRCLFSLIYLIYLNRMIWRLMDNVLSFLHKDFFFSVSFSFFGFLSNTNSLGV